MTNITDIEKRNMFQMRINELIEDEQRSTLHKRIGIASSTLSRATSYGIVPRVPTLIKIADYFNVSLDYLLGKIDFDNFVPSSDNKTFMDRINELMKAKDIATYYDLAKKLHVPRQTVNDWKNNGYYPNLEMLENIADYFEVPMDYIIGRID